VSSTHQLAAMRQYQKSLIKIRASIRGTEQTPRKQWLVLGSATRQRLFLVPGCRCGSQSGTLWQLGWQTPDSPVAVVLASVLQRMSSARPAATEQVYLACGGNLACTAV